ncbi:MAG: hypothetical protein ACPGVG_19910, partial [Mycobacterium sp.]
ARAARAAGAALAAEAAEAAEAERAASDQWWVDWLIELLDQWEKACAEEGATLDNQAVWNELRDAGYLTDEEAEALSDAE